MLFYYFTVSYQLQIDREYYIESVEPMLLRLTQQKANLRFKSFGEIEPAQESDDPIFDSFKFLNDITGDENKYKISTNSKYITKKASDNGVIATDVAEDFYSSWAVKPIGEEHYEIKQKDRCLTLTKYDSKLGGYFLNALLCKSLPEQKFKITPKPMLGLHPELAEDFFSGDLISKPAFLEHDSDFSARPQEMCDSKNIGGLVIQIINYIPVSNPRTSKEEDYQWKDRKMDNMYNYPLTHPTGRPLYL